MLSRTLSLDLQDADHTAGLARTLGRVLVPGDTILLTGDVGAGKTHFARALILSLLTHPEDVPSPTFTLVQTYESTRGTIWHADLYRLTSSFEIEELGLTALDVYGPITHWSWQLKRQVMTPGTSSQLG